jgi:hypothetical protein
MSPLRILYSIGEKVKKYLPQPHLVPNEAVGNIPVNIGIEAEGLFSQTHADNVDRIVDQGGKKIINRDEFQLAGFDFGKVKNVIYD